MAQKPFGMSGKVGARFTGGTLTPGAGTTPFPSDPEAALREAISMVQAGRLADAESRCRFVLEKRPDNPDALHLLGIVALRHNRVAEAGPLLERAARLNPRNPDFQTNLGVAYMAVGREADGVARFHAALEVHSGHGDAHFNLGLHLLRSQGPAAALEHLRTAAKLMPKHAGAQMHLGLALTALEGPAQGLRFFEKAVELAPRDPRALSNLGAAYADLGRDEDALAQLDAAVKLAPQVAEVHYARARILDRLGRNRADVLGFREAVRLNDGFAAAHCNLGRLLAARGLFGEGERQVRKAVALKPDDTGLNLDLVDILAANDRIHMAVTVCQGLQQKRPDFAPAYVRQAILLQEAGDYDAAREVIDTLRHIDDNPLLLLPLLAGDPEMAIDETLIEAAAAALDGDAVPPEQAAAASFALGKVLERREQFDEAFDFYRRGNARVAGAGRPAAAALTRTVEALTRIFDKAAFGNPAKAGVADDRPVFIVGMPRAGLTLVEQILAGHRGVSAAGEPHDFTLVANELPELLACSEEYPECIRRLDTAKLQEIGRVYLARRSQRFADARRIVDRTPENFLHLGLIALAMPNARVIHCRRDPLDTCFSMFAEDLGAKRGYAGDVEALGEAYGAYRRLMEHWARVLPLPVLALDYEALVADPEAKIREILEFCGLNWDEDCLRFHEVRRTVRTANPWQVRQPVYETSIGRARRFDRQLGALKEALARNGVAADGAGPRR